MTAALGQALVAAALLFALLGALFALAGGMVRPEHALGARARRAGRRLALLFALAMLGANLLMEYALIAPDFSVHYAAQVASRASPLWISIVSLWSSLEGSILFWGLILGAAIALLARAGAHGDGAPSAIAGLSPTLSVALGVALLVAVAFCLLLVGPADPFLPVFPVPLDGPGPNPLLQNHLLMVIHPPMLYLGYVGATVPFALACAMLLRGAFDAAALALLRRALLAVWLFLTAGIALGALWAYEVLGWGGYWAWDPVENASLMPWLTATAALHSLLVTHKRGRLLSWSFTLVLATFLLTLLGTFMTRSGVVNSVHSFSQSTIGPWLLTILALASLGSLALLTLRLSKLEQSMATASGASTFVSRMSVLLLNNVLLVTLTFVVLVGSLFPLVAELLEGRRLSVGEPYFNALAVPLAIALLFLMAVGPALPWAGSGRDAARRLAQGALLGLTLLLAALLLGASSPWLLATLFMAGLALHITLAKGLEPALAKGGAPFANLGAFVRRAKGRRHLGAYLAHLGLIVALSAIGVSHAGRSQVEASLAAGEEARLGPYLIQLAGFAAEAEPHRQSLIARFAVYEGEHPREELAPRMNYYSALREPVATPAILSRPSGDLYLSLISVDPATGRVGLRAYLNPLVPWIWLGALLMALGAGLSLLPESVRATETAKVPQSIGGLT